MEYEGKKSRAIDKKILQGIEDLENNDVTFQSIALERGFYVDILKKMEKKLGKNAVLVVNSNALDTHQAWNAIFAHLGLHTIEYKYLKEGMHYKANEASKHGKPYKPCKEVV